MTVPAIEIEHLFRRFHHEYALRDITLTQAAGSTLLLVGPNGAGKTTLLRVLATALRSSAGRVRIFDRDAAREPDRVRSLTGYLGTAHGMYDTLTARENLAFALEMGGGVASGEGAAPTALVAEALAWAGLEHLAARRLGSLSQGMKRRLALARIRLRRPAVLLLDEPFTGLDAGALQLVEALVRDVTWAGGAAVLATHEWERALPLADLVVGLENGRQVSTGPARAVTPPEVRAMAGGRR